MRFSLAGIGIVLIAGCGSDPKPVDSNVVPAPTTSSPSVVEPATKPKHSAPSTPKTEAVNPSATKEAPTPKPETPKPPSIPPRIPEPGTGGFTPVKEIQAVKVLESAEKSIAALRNVRLGHQVWFVTPVGKGTGELISIIKDPSNYIFRYAKLQPISKTQHNFVSYVELAKKGAAQTLVGDKYQKGRLPVELKGLDSFQNDYSQRVLNAYTGGSSLAEIARAASKSGWQTSVEKKLLDTGPITRVTLKNLKGTKKTIQITLDGKRNLPLEILVDEETKTPTRFTSRLQWQQSDTPLTEADITPSVKTDPMKGKFEMGKS